MRYTDAELAELGITRTVAKGRGREQTEAFLVKCVRCGRPVLRFSLVLSKPTYCASCRNSVKAKLKYAAKAIERDAMKLERLMGLNPKNEDRFSKAAKIVGKLGDYSKAIERASQGVNKYGSIPEAIAAIILVSCGIKIIPQVKIYDKKRVDFVLPDRKAVLEVDGMIYHANTEKQYCRDEILRYKFGHEWDIIHYPAEHITKDPIAFRQFIIKRFVKSKSK